MTSERQALEQLEAELRGATSLLKRFTSRAEQAEAKLEALEALIATAIACAERDCLVNPQFAGGLRPIIAILKEGLAEVLGRLPREEKA